MRHVLPLSSPPPGPSCRINPALPTLWLGPQRLRIGLDSPQALILDQVSPAEERLLAVLMSDRGSPDPLADIAEQGVDLPECEQLFDVLVRAGVLTWSRSTVAQLRDLHTSASSAATLEPSETGDYVVVSGCPSLTSTTTALLKAEGMTRVVETRDVAHHMRVATHDPALVISWHEFSTPMPLARDLMALGIPHLPVVAHGTSISVGPLVKAGRSACLRCIDLHRLSKDPSWLTVATWLQHPSRRAAAPESATLMAAASACVAQLALTVLERTPQTELSHVECRFEYAQVGPTLVPWLPHPACGCGAMAA